MRTMRVCGCTNYTKQRGYITPFYYSYYKSALNKAKELFKEHGPDSCFWIQTLFVHECFRVNSNGFEHKECNAPMMGFHSWEL